MATINQNLSDYNKDTIPNAKNFRFGIVVSEWNSTITDNLFKGAFDTLVENGALPENIIKWDVPGSFELIYGSKKMQHQDVDVVIAIGCVKTIQRALNITADGVIGPVTLKAIQETNAEEFIDNFTDAKESFYKSLANFQTFGRGWLNRVAKSKRIAEEMIV